MNAVERENFVTILVNLTLVDGEKINKVYTIIIVSVYFIIIQDGYGCLTYFTGDMYQGSWRDGLRQGKVQQLSCYYKL